MHNQVPTLFDFLFFAPSVPFVRSRIIGWMLSRRRLPSSSSGKRFKTTEEKEQFVSINLLKYCLFQDTSVTVLVVQEKM